MHYELYLDSLFLINLCMNLYLLMLVDRSTLGGAVPWRIAAGAAAGAVCSLLPFFVSAPAWLKLAAGGCLGTVGMLCITFPIRSLRMFLKLLERLLLYSFGIGGGMLFLIGRLPFLRKYFTGICGVLSMGGVLFLLFKRFRYGLNTKQCLCGAVLIQGKRRVETVALIDSGNGLTEPISGKPVCVVDQELYDSLWDGEDIGFRAIPYHSIGKKRGIMRGYLLSRLLLEVDGMSLEFRDVYMAVGGERISGEEEDGQGDVKMIVNPRLIEEKGRGICTAGASWKRDKRKKLKKGELKNDIQSGNAG